MNAPASQSNETSRQPSAITCQLALLAAHAPISRRVHHAGEHIYHAVDAFDRLYVVGAGLCKTIEVSRDGREQVVAVHFKGDWMGLGGIAAGHYGCDAIAMDTCEVWSISYEALIQACARTPALLSVMHLAMSRELLRERATMLALCTLPADARVAEFLRWWAAELDERGMRTDCLRLPMSRAEIGNFLGMTLESVSRAFSRLAKRELIRFTDRGRRDIEIPALAALGDFSRRCLADRDGAVVALH
jgi:CRP/FNR family transcriptional regulator